MVTVIGIERETELKALVCELCGGNELLKEGGLFVCQHCGTKYAPEEAKKLFVEISNPVKVEGVANCETLLERAKNLLEEQKRDEAYAKFNEVLDLDPANAEAREYVRKFDNVDKVGGNIYIQYRGPSSVFKRPWLFVNGKQIGTMEDGDNYAFYANPGVHVLSATDDHREPNAFTARIRVSSIIEIYSVKLRFEKTGFMSSGFAFDIERIQ